MSDPNNTYVIDSKVLMATQKYGKVRIGQAIRSGSGVSFARWVLHDRSRKCIGTLGSADKDLGAAWPIVTRLLNDPSHENYQWIRE